jgi:hypothetical protein
LFPSRSFPRLPDRSGLGSLVEKLVQLPGSDGRDQGIDHHRRFVLGRDDDPGLALLELDGFAYAVLVELFACRPSARSFARFFLCGLLQADAGPTAVVVDELDTGVWISWYGVALIAVLFCFWLVTAPEGSPQLPGR